MLVLVQNDVMVGFPTNLTPRPPLHVMERGSNKGENGLLSPLSTP
jgi:hypothetical protein